ncbi:hypothetical protein [Limimaricola soesokkakensis]|uniref:hypothetical protein n=1 Tax=Limimaricola soesokkakensis TaxID=1343159 RepID=UPI0035132459
MLDEEAPAPARTIHAHGLQKKVNLISGRKISGVNQTESMLESNIVVAAHVDPRVIKIEAQPLTFDLRSGHEYASKSELHALKQPRGYRPWIYTPDFRVTLRDGSRILVEGKHTSWLKQNPEFDRVLIAVGDLGHRITLVTETLFSSSLVRNLRLLKPLTGSRDETLGPSVQGLKAGGPVRAAKLLSSGMSQRSLFLTLLSGRLRCDLAAQPLGPSTLVELGDGSTTHLEVLPL